MNIDALVSRHSLATRLARIDVSDHPAWLAACRHAAAAVIDDMDEIRKRAHADKRFSNGEAAYGYHLTREALRLRREYLESC